MALNVTEIKKCISFNGDNKTSNAADGNLNAEDFIAAIESRRKATTPSWGEARTMEMVSSYLTGAAAIWFRLSQAYTLKLADYTTFSTNWTLGFLPAFKKQYGKMTVHAAGKPYKCETCDYNCVNKAMLDKHVKRVHKKGRVFSCHVCQRRFGQKVHLDVHMHAVHLHDRPYHCDECGYVAATKGMITKHIFTMHRHTCRNTTSPSTCRRSRTSASSATT